MRRQARWAQAGRLVQDPQICNWRVMCNVVVLNVQYGLVMNEWSHLLVKWLPHVYMSSPTHTAPNPSRPLLHFFLFTGVFVTYRCCFFHLLTPIDCNCQTAVVSKGCSCAYMQISDLVAHALGLFLTTTILSGIPWQSAALVVESETGAVVHELFLAAK